MSAGYASVAQMCDRAPAACRCPQTFALSAVSLTDVYNIIVAQIKIPVNLSVPSIPENVKNKSGL
jgi:hypothetical protein